MNVDINATGGEDYAAVLALEYAYARCIADNRLEDWPQFFVEDCLYKILPRENRELGMPLGLMTCDSRGMLEDRVRSLREASIYNIHYPLLQISNVEIIDRSEGVLQVRANYASYQTNQDGQTSVYSVGQYFDKIVMRDGEPRFLEKLVVLDTFNVPNLLAIPL